MALFGKLRKQFASVTSSSESDLDNEFQFEENSSEGLSFAEMSASLSPTPQKTEVKSAKQDSASDIVPQYSQGMEKIYELKDVNVSSIRKMSSPASPVSKMSSGNTKTHSLTQSAATEVNPISWVWDKEFQLDFGPSFRDWIEPFRLDEPVQVLGLAPAAEKELLSNKCIRLRDLLAESAGQGLGQGHIDEMREKLLQYLGAKRSGRTRTVDFGGLLRCALGGVDRFRAHILVEPYGLGHLFPLTKSQEVEKKHLNAAKHKEMCEDAKQLLSEREIVATLKSGMEKIFEALVNPWVRKRLDLATKTEIEHRLMHVSEDRKVTKGFLSLWSDCISDEEELFSYYLHQVEQKVFCTMPGTRDSYQQCMRQLDSYFYNLGITYPLDELLSFVARESTRMWWDYPEGFVEKVLRISDSFELFRNKQGVLELGMR